MAVSKPISQIIFGGIAENNPPDYSYEDYRNYPDMDLSVNYVRMNVIMHEKELTLSVTALIRVSPLGFPMVSPNDVAYMPCPPLC